MSSVLRCFSSFYLRLRHRAKEEDGLVSDEEIYTYARLVIFAGKWTASLLFKRLNHPNILLISSPASETTANGITSTLHNLCLNPQCLEKVTQEVRTKFNANSEITCRALESCSYLSAVLQETLRMTPPVLSEHARFAPPMGKEIAGRSVPGGTCVVTSRYAAHMSTRNWKEPGRYLPERWLGDPRFVNDHRDASRPFGNGARICLGRT